MKLPGIDPCCELEKDEFCRRRQWLGCAGAEADGGGWRVEAGLQVQADMSCWEYKINRSRLGDAKLI